MRRWTNIGLVVNVTLNSAALNALEIAFCKRRLKVSLHASLRNGRLMYSGFFGAVGITALIFFEKLMFFSMNFSGYPFNFNVSLIVSRVDCKRSLEQIFCALSVNFSLNYAFCGLVQRYENGDTDRSMLVCDTPLEKACCRLYVLEAHQERGCGCYVPFLW